MGEFDQPKRVLNHTDDRLCTSGDDGIPAGGSKVVNATLASQYHTEWTEWGDLEVGEDIEFLGLDEEPNSGSEDSDESDEETDSEPHEESSEDDSQDVPSGELSEDFPHSEVLIDAGLNTVEDIENFLSNEDNALTDINGIGSAKQDDILEAIGQSG